MGNRFTEKFNHIKLTRCAFFFCTGNDFSHSINIQINMLHCALIDLFTHTFVKCFFFLSRIVFICSLTYFPTLERNLIRFINLISSTNCSCWFFFFIFLIFAAKSLLIYGNQILSQNNPTKNTLGKCTISCCLYGYQLLSCWSTENNVVVRFFFACKLTGLWRAFSLSWATE